MSGWESVALSDVLADVRPGFACGEDAENGVFQFRMNNITTEGRLELSKKRRVPPSYRDIEDFLVERDDVLFNATNSPELVGKTAYFGGLDEPAVFSNHFLRLRPDPNRLDGRYLARWLNLQFDLGIFKRRCRQWVNQATVGRDTLLAEKMPLPPLAEQRRIADILDKADALRTTRRAALAQLDTLAQSIFFDMFGDLRTNTKKWSLSKIGALADVQGGLQVTSARKLLPIELPYLRVANVYRGVLDLQEIKTIRATTAEVARTRLLPDDLLIVEGHGNPAEIGRVALWNGSIVNCTHQNHLIRARVDIARVSPTYCCEYLNSSGGRQHLLRAGKTTSGLNTISVSDVRETPVAVPPIELQREFAQTLARIDLLKGRQRRAQFEDNALFNALQHRAFRGELTSSAASKAA
jgi:type I restriction enzyme, S subunit